MYEDHPDFLIDATKDDESMSTKSHLRVLSADVDKTGEVTCIASAISPVNSMITLPSDNVTASLTVLGESNSFV